ncbi:MAG: HNH endonuclease [Hyphomicrobiales bacterium]
MICWKKKDFDNPPEVLKSTGCARKIKSAVDQKSGSVYNGYYYSHDQVKEKLKAYSINQDFFSEANGDQAKCYYCESFTEACAALQVEHYRPKSKVDGVSEHHGYYWLGCEWTNLLLACPKCNQQNAKGNKFPVGTMRVFDHNPIVDNRYVRTQCYVNRSPLIEERPLLFHPEVDGEEIARNLSFDINGQIYGHSDRANATITICRLNRRNLIISRKGILDELMNRINLVILSCEQSLIPFENVEKVFCNICLNIKESFDCRKKYTLFARCFNENFNVFFVDQVPQRYKDPLREAWRRTSAE